MLEPKPGEPDPGIPNPTPQKEFKPTPAQDADGFTPGTQNPDEEKKDE